MLHLHQQYSKRTKDLDKEGQQTQPEGEGQNSGWSPRLPYEAGASLVRESRSISAQPDLCSQSAADFIAILLPAYEERNEYHKNDNPGFELY